ncbi:hypothetical protein [Aeoliella mucimassa]|uniref:Uncharacterized protein n=1 Tax=Aeoliella mucimassa TaxID=2527972 RepID=A0A518AIB7_9BACT|nr:hypothetical protein [Aeoliella mucimassa]QDU54468.1 hypothetical protein Pan181_06500 [Aeoliella mucimassa]
MLNSLFLATTSSATFVYPLLADLKNSLAWGLVILAIVLGMLVTLQPVKRTKEFKGRQD